MRRKNLRFSTVVIPAMLMAIFAIVTAQAGIVKLAEDGEAEPNGTNIFFGTRGGLLNDAGQVMFRSTLYSPTGFLQGWGIYLADGAAVVTLAHAPQPAPDLNGNFYEFWSYAISNTNQVFVVTMKGALDGGEDPAICEITGGQLIMLARNGQPAPGGGEFGISQTGQGQVAINRDGQTAFTCTTNGGNPTSVVYRSTGSTLTPMAYKNEVSPGGGGKFLAFDAPALNDNGQVAFFASLNSTVGIPDGLFVADGVALTALALARQTVPDGNGYFNGFDHFLLNDSGQVAFQAPLAGTTGGTADNQGLYRADGSSIIQLVRKGQLVPDGNGRFLDFAVGDGYFSMNNSGGVVFLADLTGTTGGTADNAGVFLSDGNAVTQLGRKGQAAPDGNGQFSSFQNPALNNRGQVAFVASLTGTAGGSTDNQGIFLVDSSGAIQQVVRAGQTIAGQAVAGFNLATAIPNHGGNSVLNDNGQLAFGAGILPTGHDAVYLWSPPDITAISPVGNDIRVTWENFGGTTNVLQATSDLSSNFTDIATLAFPGSRLVRTNSLDPGGSIHRFRFYRIRETK